MAKWPFATLAEACSDGGLIQTGPFGSQLHKADYRPAGIPVIMPTNIRDGRVVEDGIAYIHPADAERLARHRTEVGDIVFSRRGEVDKCAVITERERGWLCGTGCLLARPNARKANPYFLGYSISTHECKSWLRQHAVGATMPNLNTGILQRLPVPWPDKAVQDEVAGILQSLDNKIELNRRMNETLEAQARALFRDWFVDFGPVKAKMAGDASYLAPDLWSLFPDRLDDDGVPEGWHCGKLDEIVQLNPREKLTKGANAPYLDMASLPTQGLSSDAPILRPFASGSKFRNGDALLARITPCLENGKTAFVDMLDDEEVGWGSTEFIVMRAKAPVPPHVAYLIARDSGFRGAAIRSMSGTSGRQRASADALASYPIAVPANDQLWVRSGEFFEPLFRKIRANSKENQTLAQTRDLLLPKLMSGEIRVGEAAKELEGV